MTIMIQNSNLINELKSIVEGDVFADILHRAAFSTDASIYRIVPQYVIAPRNKNDIANVIKLANQHGIPMAARGAGSGLAGEALTSGIVFDTTKYMNKIIHINEDHTIVTCEPGVVLDELNSYLLQFGKKIGPDPSSGNRATIGGCFANNATGAHSLQYGYFAEFAESVEAVLSDGSIVNFTNNFVPDPADNSFFNSIAKSCFDLLSKNEKMIETSLPETKRNRSGFNIAHLCHDGKIDLAKILAGSEGTLAVFTKITLKTVDIPKSKAMLLLEFDSLDKMALAVPYIVDCGASACEVMDNFLLKLAADAMPQYRDILPVKSEIALFAELTGDNINEVKDKILKTENAVKKYIIRSRPIFDSLEQKRLAKARKDAVPLLFRGKSKKKPVSFIEDVSVKNTKLSEYIKGLVKIGEKYGVQMAYYGHAGDGEIHVRPFLNLKDPQEIKKMIDIVNETFNLAWSLGGSISGEHADGLVRAAFIRKQYGDDFYNILCQIKNIFDPTGILNPGKIINSDPDIMIKNLRAEYSVQPNKLKAELFFEGDEFAIELEQCSGCGLCLSQESELRLCPVFRAMEDELASSRGRANIINMWASGQISDEDFESQDFRKFLDLCINCKACAIECPSGVDVSKLVIAARTELARRKGLKISKLALTKNRMISKLNGFFAPLSNFVLALPVAKWFLNFTTVISDQRNLPNFKRGSFFKKAQKYLNSLPPLKDPIDKVAYFADTFAASNDHQLGLDVLKVLHQNNIEVIIPNQLPAPIPAIVYGDIKTAVKDLSYSVKYLSQAVKDGYKIICSEPTAALCLKQELRHFVDSADARLVSENTYELMNYLYDLCRQGKLTKPQKSPAQNTFVYHTPCHLFALEKAGSSVKLLKELCGINVKDLKAGCCGLAGTFGMQQQNYELSMKIAKNLQNALSKYPTAEVLTECAVCAMQIEHISNLKTCHPIKILAQIY